MASTHIPTRPVAIVDHDDDELQLEDPPGPSDISRIPAYTYDVLPPGNTFRLLVLKPGDRADTLHCDIQTYSLDAFNIPPYRALSYTWSDSKYDRLIAHGEYIPMSHALRKTHAIRHPIWCGEKRLLISTNLRDALRQLRHATLPIKLWVDAICINQEDDSERTIQILLMQRIYHTAQHINFWLGGQDQHSDTAIKLLKDLAVRGARANFESDKLPTLSTLYDPSALQNLGLPIFPSQAWESLIQFFMRPVFRRIWIIQELVTARKITCLCGWTGVIEYGNLTKGVLFLDRTNWRMPLDSLYAAGQNVMSSIDAIQVIRPDWYLRTTDVYGLVHDTRMFDATDPRDKIYALVGLLNDFAHRGVHDLAASHGYHDHRHSYAHDHVGLIDEANQNAEVSETIAIWAEDKYQAGESLNILGTSLDSRILRLSTRLQELLSLLLDFTSSLQSGPRLSANNDAIEVLYPRPFKYNLDSEEGFHAYRKEIDEAIIDLRDQLDEHCGEDLNSDTLCADRYASELVEDLKHQYNKIWIRSQGDIDDRTIGKIKDLAFQTGDILAQLRGSSDDEWSSDVDGDSYDQRESDGYDGDSDEANDSNSDEAKDGNSDEANDSNHDGGGYESNNDETDDKKPPKEISEDEKDDSSEGRRSSFEEGRRGGNDEVEDEDEMGSDHSKPGKGVTTIDGDRNGEVRRTFFPRDVEGEAEEPEGHANELEMGGTGVVNVLAPDTPPRIPGPPPPPPPSLPAEPGERPRQIVMASSSGTTSVLPEWVFTGKPATPEHPIITSTPLKPWSHELTASLLPDYRLSAPEVYKTFTLRWLSDSKTLSFLSAVEDPSLRKHADMPSWVPDYSVCLTYSSLVTPYSQNRYTASGPKASCPHAYIATDPDVSPNSSAPEHLVLKSHRIDRISALTNTDGPKHDLSSNLVKEWITLPRKLPPSYIAGGSTYSALWRTLIGNRPHFPLTQYPAPASYELYYQAFLKFFGIESSPPTSPRGNFAERDNLEESHRDKLQESAPPDKGTAPVGEMMFMDALRCVMLGRRLFLTEQGYLGAGPSSAKVGDTVCIFEGGEAPYVVRAAAAQEIEPEPTSEPERGKQKQAEPTSGSEMPWTFIGECYVHGVMDGEAMARTGFKWEEMRLR